MFHSLLHDTSTVGDAIQHTQHTAGNVSSVLIGIMICETEIRTELAVDCNNYGLYNYT